MIARHAMFLRFLAVGGVFALIYALLAATLAAHLAWPVAVTSALAWIACIPLAYACQRRIAFRAARVRRGALALYAATQGASLIVVSTAGALFVTRDWLWDAGVYLAASALAAVLSFALNRFVVFAPAGHEKGPGVSAGAPQS